MIPVIVDCSAFTPMSQLPKDLVYCRKSAAQRDVFAGGNACCALHPQKPRVLSKKAMSPCEYPFAGHQRSACLRLATQRDRMLGYSFDYTGKN
jgi:hypothetical protein